MKKFKKPIALLMAMLLVVSALAACGDNTEQPNDTDPQNSSQPSQSDNTDPGTDVDEGPVSYIFKDSVSTLASNWNPHTYQTVDDSYPLDYTTSSLYTTVYND